MRLLSLLFIVILSVPSLSHAALGDNLAACYDFEANGNDSSANANNLNNNNSTPFFSGLINNAADMEATSDQTFSRADTATLSITGSLSISMWIRVESNVESGLVAKLPSTAANRSYAFRKSNDAGGRLHWNFFDSGGTEYEMTWNWVASTATWYHVVLVYDAPNHSANVWINNSALGAVDTTGTSIRDTAGAFSIGADRALTDTFDGMIDTTAIFARTLSAGDITALYNSGAGTNCTTIIGVSATPKLPEFIFIS